MKKLRNFSRGVLRLLDSLWPHCVKRGPFFILASLRYFHNSTPTGEYTEARGHSISATNPPKSRLMVYQGPTSGMTPMDAEL